MTDTYDIKKKAEAGIINLCQTIYSGTPWDQCLAPKFFSQHYAKYLDFIKQLNLLPIKKQYAAWTILFTIRFKCIRQAFFAASNSSNCKFLILEPTPYNQQTQKLFVKMVDETYISHADLVLLDVINGIMMQSFSNQDHVMQFNDCFFTIYNNLSWNPENVTTSLMKGKHTFTKWNIRCIGYCDIYGKSLDLDAKC